MSKKPLRPSMVELWKDWYAENSAEVCKTNQRDAALMGFQAAWVLAFEKVLDKRLEHAYRVSRDPLVVGDFEEWMQKA